MIYYENACRKLEELMLELIKKGVAIPQQVIDDLKSARSLISVFQAEPEDSETAVEPTPFLEKAEANLLCLAEAEIGKEYADEWQKKVSVAYWEKAEKPLSGPKFVSGIPKSEYWIRIKTTDLAIGSEISELMNRFALAARPEEDGYLLIHGKKEDVSSFLKEVRQKVGRREDKCKN